ncbi:MAG: hypothetical protein AAGA26_00200 [Pseudomonadota bacterium]
MAREAISFANLMGRGRPKANDEGDGDAENDTAAEDTAADDDEASADDQTDGAAESDDGGDEAADGAGESDEEQAAYARGRAAERARIAAILSHASVGPHNIAQAAQIATGTDLSPEQAAKVLGAASPGGSLGARLAAHDTALAPAGDGGRANSPSLKERAESKRNNR